MNYGFHNRKHPLVVKRYSDANWISNDIQTPNQLVDTLSCLEVLRFLEILKENVYSMFYNGIGICSIRFSCLRSRIAKKFYAWYSIIAKACNRNWHTL